MAYLPLKANLYTLCLIVGFICAATKSVHSSQRHKFCGPKLVKVLAKVCLAFPTLPPPNKRTNNGVDMNDYNSVLLSQDWQFAVEQPEDSHMSAVERLKNRPNWMKAFFPKHDNGVVEEDYFNEFIPDRFMIGKRREGIVEECCKKGCTYEYLIMHYCDTSQLMK